MSDRKSADIGVSREAKYLERVEIREINRRNIPEKREVKERGIILEEIEQENLIREWSEIRESVIVRECTTLGWEITRSSVLPKVWVGDCTNCLRLKRSNISMKLEEVSEEILVWILKSPRRRRGQLKLASIER